MPIALDPDRTIDIVLKLDEGKPNPPAFVCKFLTGRQVAKVQQLRAAVSERGLIDQQAIDQLSEALGVGLVGWRNLPGEFAVGRLADVLTFAEMFELAGKMVTRTDATEEELKNSASPSASATAPSPTA